MSQTERMQPLFIPKNTAHPNIQPKSTTTSTVAKTKKGNIIANKSSSCTGYKTDQTPPIKYLNSTIDGCWQGCLMWKI